MASAAFISTEALVQNSLINGNVEDSILTVVIDRTQRAAIEPLIGTSLYNRLIAGIIADDLNPDEKTLLDDYISQVMYTACDVRAVVPVLFQTRNKAVSKGTDPTATPVQISEATKVTDEMRTDVNVAKKRLVGYLLDNCKDYPEYDQAECSYEFMPPSKNKEQGKFIFIT